MMISRIKTIDKLGIIAAISIMIFSGIFLLNNTNTTTLSEIKGLQEADDLYNTFSQINEDTTVNYDFDDNKISIDIPLTNDSDVILSEIKSLEKFGWQHLQEENCFIKQFDESYSAVKSTLTELCIENQKINRIITLKNK